MKPEPNESPAWSARGSLGAGKIEVVFRSFRGGMAEWTNAKLLKSFGMQVPGGSNPSPSAAQRLLLRIDHVASPVGQS